VPRKPAAAPPRVAVVVRERHNRALHSRRQPASLPAHGATDGADGPSHWRAGPGATRIVLQLSSSRTPASGTYFCRASGARRPVSRLPPVECLNNRRGAAGSDGRPMKAFPTALSQPSRPCGNLGTASAWSLYRPTGERHCGQIGTAACTEAPARPPEHFGGVCGQVSSHWGRREATVDATRLDRQVARSQSRVLAQDGCCHFLARARTPTSALVPDASGHGSGAIDDGSPGVTRTAVRVVNNATSGEELV
jgi:hypothetical protein